MSKFVLSRRKLLRGAAYGVGAAVGLPILEAMLHVNGEALAAGEPLPRRFGEFFWGNGVVANQWFPTGGPALTLSPLLQPLAGVKDSLSVVSGTVVYVPYQVPGHFGSLMAITSGALGTPQGGLNYAYANKTMDQAIAEKIGTTTRFRSLHLGVASTDASDADFGAVNKSISHNGPNSPNLPEFNPIALYDRVFGTVFDTDGGTSDLAAITLANRRSVLDLVAEETRALQSRLGASDRQRLDQHLQGIADLEKQLAPVQGPAPTCTAPTREPSAYPAIDAEQIQWEALMKAQTNLLVHALACDQTRVFTFRFSPCNDFTVYPGFPPFNLDPNDTNTGTSMHGFTHTEGGSQPNVQKCVTFVMTKFAELLQALRDRAEGAGTLLDNCAILGFSECTEGRTHNATVAPGIPILIAGKAGGRLRTGVHYQSPRQGDAAGEDQGRNVSVVPLTLMQALDTGITSWGKGAGLATKVISELLV